MLGRYKWFGIGLIIIVLWQPEVYSEKGRLQRAGEQIHRGVVQIVTSPWEIVYQIQESTKGERGLLMAPFGAGKGVAKAIWRFTMGCFDIVTLPIVLLSDSFQFRGTDSEFLFLPDIEDDSEESEFSIVERRF